VKQKKNIQYIVNGALCTGCGGCSGICPTKAIEMRWNAAGYLVADVDVNRCNTCGLCCKICPSVAANAVSVDGCDPFHGVCLNAYIGHSTDAEVRESSQSGGIVTSLLLTLLGAGLVDVAVVNRFCKQTKRPEVFCAATKEDLISAAGSYYCQSSVAKTIFENGGKRLAAVVLGCQTECIRLVRKALRGTNNPEYTIGLICAGQYSGHYIDDLISLAGAESYMVNLFRFRDKRTGAWPGDVKVHTNEQEYVLDKKFRLRLKPAYEAYRCLLCFDQMNIYSDLVVGDPWGISNAENKKGNSVIITRTQKGQDLIDRAVEQRQIKLTQLSVEDVIRGQTVDGRLKTQFFTAVNSCRKSGHLLPVTESHFQAIAHIVASRKQARIINDRLQYSRRIYLEETSEAVRQVRTNRKKSLIRGHRIAELINFAKRLTRFLVRLFYSGKW